MRAVKILVLTVAILAMAGRSEANSEYTAAEAGQHVGETATVTDKVDRVNKAGGGNTFINLGGHDRGSQFTIFISGKDAEAVGDMSKYQGKTVSITGTITTFKDKPQIQVTAASQITEKEEGASGGSASPAATDKASPSPTPKK